MIDNLTGLSKEDLLKDEMILASTYSSLKGGVGPLVSSVFFLILAVALLVYSLTLKDAGWIIYAVYFVCGLLFIASMLGFLGIVRRRYRVRYFLTNFRVIKRAGIISKKIDYVLYSKIQDVKLEKGVTARLLDIGDIRIDVAGGPGIELVLENISDPEKYNNIILEKMREKETNRL